MQTIEQLTTEVFSGDYRVANNHSRPVSEVYSSCKYQVFGYDDFRGDLPTTRSSRPPTRRPLELDHYHSTQ